MSEAAIVATLRANGFKVLTRKQWGSRRRAVYQMRRVTRRFVGAADHAFAHITVTNDTGDAKRDARTIEDIGTARFSTGWSYNWGIHRSTRTIIVGQPLDAAGAHTLNDKNVPGFPKNLNYWGHAIAFIAQPGDPFDEWCQSAVAAILAAERKHGAMKESARLHPHSRFAYKDCPCDPYRDSIPTIERLSQSEEDDMPFSEQQLRQIIREEVGAVLDEDMNEHEPKGSPRFRGVTLRGAIKGIFNAVVPADGDGSPRA